MAPIPNGRVLFQEIPTGYPEPGTTTVYDDSESIDVDNVPLNGGFLVQVLVLSIDPYMRGRMRAPHIKSYVAAFIIGEPLENFGVSVVVRSESEHVKAGDHVYGMYPFQNYVVFKDISELRLARVLDSKLGLPWSVYVGVCGLAGHTAHHAWMEFAKPKRNDVVFVTAGAGPVGSTVIQLAKQAGCKVIASAGSEEKVNFLRSIGTDVAFNYKMQNTLGVLLKEGPIDIYWDNVGGESLDAALEAAAWHARFIECGMVSTYNNSSETGTYAVKNLPLIVKKSLALHGFTVMDFHDKYAEQFYAEFPRMVKEGTIKYTEDVSIGLESVGEAILDVQMGRNKGKKAIIVSQE